MLTYFCEKLQIQKKLHSSCALPQYFVHEIISTMNLCTIQIHICNMCYNMWWQNTVLYISLKSISNVATGEE